MYMTSQHFTPLRKCLTVLMNEFIYLYIYMYNIYIYIYIYTACWFAPSSSVVHLGSGEERSEDAIMMNTPVIKSALEMGFERSLVKQTVQSKILTSGENYRTVQELVLDLLSAEDQKREEEREMLAEAMASGKSGNVSAMCRP